MKKIILSILGFISFLGVSSQELNLPQMNQYLSDNEFLITPTFAGIGDYVKLRLSGVSQWVGIKDAPDYQSFAGDMRIGNRSGAGLILYNDKNGYTQQAGGKISFAHHLTLDSYDNHFVSFGISYVLNTFRIDIDKFKKPITDSKITDNRSTINHNFDISALYRFKKWFVSLMIANILNKELNYYAVNEPSILRNYNVYAGYRYKKDKSSDYEIEPSVFFQYYESDGRSSTDINLKFRWLNFEDYYWVGVNYRFLNDQIFKPLDIGPMIGLKKSNIYFGYSYQLTLNDLIKYNSGTHIITLGVDLFQGLSNCKCTSR